MHKILLVEDDDAIATVVSAALEAEGYAVTRCSSIAARDQTLSGESYAVMLTDVMLDDGDGIETLGQVSARFPQMPIIILSAQNTLDTAVRATDTGAFEYFPKPFDLEELLRAVAQAVGSSKGGGSTGGSSNSLSVDGRATESEESGERAGQGGKNPVSGGDTGEGPKEGGAGASSSKGVGGAKRGGGPSTAGRATGEMGKAKLEQGEGEGEEDENEDENLPLVGRSPPMQAVFRMITRVLRNDLTVLILGESGTGKELVAEAIHELGHRKTGPFIAVNTAAIPSELIESELFGHERGAFTGAVGQSIGKFEQANGGTLFLDEIGDMPLEAQTRLLRTLQSGKIRRVGGKGEIAIDVRIVAATNRDLKPMIAGGSFRQDLYYRLNVVPITLPPLRERREDIADLARHFLRIAVKEGLPRRQFDAEALALLKQQNWPGNVRELRNSIYRLVLMARDDVIDAFSVRELAEDPLPSIAAQEGDAIDAAMLNWLEQSTPAPGHCYQAAQAAFERPLFRWALGQTGGNQVRAANLLGINRNTLRKRLNDLDIDPENL